MTLTNQKDGCRVVIKQTCDILLVDDDQLDAELFKIALDENFPEIALCWLPRGDQAVQFLYHQAEFGNAPTPRMVVMDINMPGQTGLEVLSLIKQNPRLAIIPVVIRSNNARKDTVENAYALGANVFFPKLLGLDESVEQVRILVRHWLKVARLPTEHSRAASFGQRDQLTH